MAPFEAYRFVRFSGPQIYFINADGYLESIEDEGEQPQAPNKVSATSLLKDEDHQAPSTGGVSSKSSEDEDKQASASSDTYSESLTRIQTGFLHAISVLQERNVRLQQELEVTHDYVQQVGQMQSQNEQLNSALTAARSIAKEMQSAPMDRRLAEKNARIKERNMKIINLEQDNLRLRTELDELKTRHLGVGGRRSGHKNHNNISAGATMTETMVQSATPASARNFQSYAKESTQQNSYHGASRLFEPTIYEFKNGGGNVAKKRKLVNFTRADKDMRSSEDASADQIVHGDEKNPVVID